MAILEKAIWKPVSWANRPVQARPGKPNVLIFHVAVSEADSLRDFFENSLNNAPVCSHFYVRRDGTIEQYINTDLRSAADLAGSARAVSVETQGGVKSPNSEKWTSQQVESLAYIAKEINRIHGIPLSVAKDSASTSSGVAWHRLGIQGNFIGEDAKYAYKRGEIWGDFGKICPGLGKIKQIAGIISKAMGGGGDAPVPKPDDGKKSLAQLALEVYRGEWGNEPERSKRLKAAGHDPVKVQAEVNKRYYSGGGGGGSAPSKSLATLALEVYRGEWGNEPQRSQRLRAAGHDPVAIQREVDRKYYNGGGSAPAPQPGKKSVTTIANEIFYGDSSGRNPWGNEPQRSQKLRSAGYSQAEINQIQGIVNRLAGS